MSTPDALMSFSGYELIFPRVIKSLRYSDQLDQSCYEVRRVNGTEMIRWYFREMYDGAKYERFVHSEENRAYPNCLTRRNFANASLIRARGWSYEGVKSLIDCNLPELARIPTDADLFETDIYDDAIVEALEVLYEYPGIQVANACKLLYQKRPRLVPILDAYVRQAVDVPWLREDGIAPVLRLAFTRLRELVNYGANGGNLDKIAEWVTSDPDITGVSELSKLRILDILAWGAIRQTTGGPIGVSEWGELEGPPHFELVNGRLKERKDDPFWHAVLYTALMGPLFSHIRQQNLGLLLGGHAKIKVSSIEGRVPDLFFIPNALMHLVGKNLFKGAPPLVIELLSPVDAPDELAEKIGDYARLGVDEVWLVNFPSRRIETYRLKRHEDSLSTYERIETVQGEDAVFRPSFFPGFEISLSDVWPTKFEHCADD